MRRSLFDHPKVGDQTWDFKIVFIYSFFWNHFSEIIRLDFNPLWIQDGEDLSGCNICPHYSNQVRQQSIWEPGDLADDVSAPHTGRCSKPERSRCLWITWSINIFWNSSKTATFTFKVSNQSIWEPGDLADDDRISYRSFGPNQSAPDVYE